MLNIAAQHAHQRMIDLYLCGRSLMDQIFCDLHSLFLLHQRPQLIKRHPGKRVGRRRMAQHQLQPGAFM
ncbi:hypothetical protein D3C87_1669990 [compost metagenome]